MENMDILDHCIIEYDFFRFFRTLQHDVSKYFLLENKPFCCYLFKKKDPTLKHKKRIFSLAIIIYLFYFFRFFFRMESSQSYDVSKLWDDLENDNGNENKNMK